MPQARRRTPLTTPFACCTTVPNTHQAFASTMVFFKEGVIFPAHMTQDSSIMDAEITIGQMKANCRKMPRTKDAVCRSTPEPGIKIRDVNNIYKIVGQIWAISDDLDGIPRTTGNERRLYQDGPLLSETTGVPVGFLQLDNSCPPTDQEFTFCSITLDSYMMANWNYIEEKGFLDILNQHKRHNNLRQLMGSSHVEKESSDDEHNIDPEYSSSKRSHKGQQQQGMIAKRVKGACASERNTPFFPLCKTRARNHSPLSGKDGNDIQLEEIHMNSSNTNAKNKNANVHSGNSASDAPFVKILTIWSAIDAKEVLKELPQQPHYLPLRQLQPEEREATALSLMHLVANLVKSIKKTSIEDSEKSFEEKMSTLCRLKEHGFNFSYLKGSLTKMLQAKENYTGYLKEKDEVNAHEREERNSLSTIETLLFEKKKAVAEQQHKLDQLLKETKDIEKEKEQK
ncbi:hypothetical protein PR202_gb13205 [Eleusine coracana subsp. coracana]|uniref:Uncharacterized protein n=1 Tax=Eleusine coracana subsp. coracana TaxID=191504 RepID=A0AAV5ES78_ELECO|nr:hypothetical protein PR202_gb13205 [Eleusine coracana subsp. coracana]